MLVNLESTANIEVFSLIIHNRVRPNILRFDYSATLQKGPSINTYEKIILHHHSYIKVIYVRTRVFLRRFKNGDGVISKMIEDDELSVLVYRSLGFQFGHKP